MGQLFPFLCFFGFTAVNVLVRKSLHSSFDLESWGIGKRPRDNERYHKFSHEHLTVAVFNHMTHKSHLRRYIVNAPHWEYFHLSYFCGHLLPPKKKWSQLIKWPYLRKPTSCCAHYNNHQWTGARALQLKQVSIPLPSYKLKQWNQFHVSVYL